MVLNIALNYGGRDEIIFGIKEMLKDIDMGKINIDDIDSQVFFQTIYIQKKSAGS